MTRCKPEANPAASVLWRRAGQLGTWSTEPEVLIGNVGKEDGGIYTCTAHNKLGVSGPKEIVLNVECKWFQNFVLSVKVILEIKDIKKSYLK